MNREPSIYTKRGRDQLIAEMKADYPHEPAEKGSVRFEIERNPEPDDPSTLYFVRVIDDMGAEVDSHYAQDPYGEVEACREVETMDLEERWAMYAEMGL